MRRKKRLVLRELFSADVSRLVAVLVEICERDRRYRDYTRQEMREPLEELLACLPVYRTYVRAGEPASERDVKVIDLAVAAAKEERPQLDDGLLQFIRALLCGHGAGELEQKLCSRFQQLSGAVMAKGCEDTAFYCHHRLVALNEVGGDPVRDLLAEEAVDVSRRDEPQRAPVEAGGELRRQERSDEAHGLVG